MQQILYLADQQGSYELNKMRFLAALQGIDFDKASKRAPRSSKSIPKATSDDKSNEPLFRHPDHYKSWTPEQREKETHRMMAILKPWAGKALG
jgi:hypothetical protein